MRQLAADDRVQVESQFAVVKIRPIFLFNAPQFLSEQIGGLVEPCRALAINRIQRFFEVDGDLVPNRSQPRCHQEQFSVRQLQLRNLGFTRVLSALDDACIGKGDDAACDFDTEAKGH
jgi:hypothetical protein